MLLSKEDGVRRRKGKEQSKVPQTSSHVSNLCQDDDATIRIHIGSVAPDVSERVTRSRPQPPACGIKHTREEQAQPGSGSAGQLTISSSHLLPVRTTPGGSFLGQWTPAAAVTGTAVQAGHQLLADITENASNLVTVVRWTGGGGPGQAIYQNQASRAYYGSLAASPVATGAALEPGPGQCVEEQAAALAAVPGPAAVNEPLADLFAFEPDAWVQAMEALSAGQVGRCCTVHACSMPSGAGPAGRC